jgi:ribulose-phosphate 3-epimerase
MIEIAPSILSADFAKLGEQIDAVKAGGANILHFDVMDGRFVPNITIGLPVLASVRKATDMIIDTHLMIVEPGNYAWQFAKAGANMVSVHIEADPNIHRTLASVRDNGGKAGVVINPATSLSMLDGVLPFCDFVLVMSVNPGFGGQAFIPEMVEKVRRLKGMIDSGGFDVKIEIDGGIDENNVGLVAKAGVDIAVAGSAVFGKSDPAAAVRRLIECGTDWV